MNTNATFQSGYLTVFGFTKNRQFLERRLPNYLGDVPRTIDFGQAGHFFFYNSSYNDLVETEETIVLKQGFLRSPTMSPLSAKELLTQKAVTSTAIDHRLFRGNALVASFSKREPKFSVFKTILSAPQLYYAVVKDGILCATGLRPLVAMLERVEINEEAIVPQFLFGAMPGPATHFRNVYRLFPGELLKWKEGNLTIDLVQDLRFADDGPLFKRADSKAIDTLYERFRGVVGAYINDIEKSDGGFANLLSGGVDSSLLQLAICEERADSRPKSFSYAVRVPSFERELKYAEQAATIFGAQHSFIEITEEEFPQLLIEATQILAQPVLTSAEVCKLGLAKSLSKMNGSPRYLFTAQGADTLFGMRISHKIKIFEYLKRVPTSVAALKIAGTLLKPFSRRGQTLLNAAETVSHLDNHDHFTAPINIEATIANFTLARRYFGDGAVRRALEDRRNREVKYLNSDNYAEKVHIVELLGDCYEIEQQGAQTFLAYNLEQLYPILDEDMIRLSFAFQPKMRYIKGSRHKYLIKEALERRITFPITRQPKGGSMFHADLRRWMKSGSLQEMVREISWPDCLKQGEFEILLGQTNTLLWHLLAFDVFKKQILKDNGRLW